MLAQGESGSSLVSAEELVVLLLELLSLQKRMNPLQVSKPTLVESGSSLVSAEELVLLLLELLSLQKRINPLQVSNKSIASQQTYTRCGRGSGQL